jgi:hypothetical protein
MGMSSQFHALVTLPERIKHHYPLYRRLDEPERKSRCFGERKILSPCQESNNNLTLIFG